MLIPREVDSIEVVSLLQNAQSCHVLILSHHAGVLLCRVRHSSISTQPTYEDTLHVTCLYFEGENLDSGQKELWSVIDSFVDPPFFGALRTILRLRATIFRLYCPASVLVTFWWVEKSLVDQVIVHKLIKLWEVWPNERPGSIVHVEEGRVQVWVAHSVDHGQRVSARSIQVWRDSIHSLKHIDLLRH